MDHNIPFPTATHLPGSPSTLCPDSESDEASLARTLEMLKNLAVLGMDFCNEIHASRTRPTAGTSTTRQQAAEALATAQTFGSLARTVRHTLSLETALRQARARRATAQAAEAKITAAAHLQEAKRELRARIEPALKATPAARGDIRNRFNNRIGDWDIEQDLAHHSVEAAIARLCRDLAIDPPPTAAASPRAP